MTVIHLSENVYNVVVENAAKRQQTPDDFVEELLVQQLLPSHPYVEVVQSRSQPRAVVKGTQVGVDVIIGYIQAGYTPQDIVVDVLPHLTLAQIYDVLSYYEDHRATIDEVLKHNTTEAWREKLYQRLGEQAASQLLGE